MTESTRETHSDVGIHDSSIAISTRAEEHSQRLVCKPKDELRRVPDLIPMESFLEIIPEELLLILERWGAVANRSKRRSPPGETAGPYSRAV